ncbi:MAG: Mrp/NBP35 family ATP-binding protein, partial [Candidatus Rokuibacteriota bacterium]
MTTTESAVLTALRAVRDPDQGQDIVSLGLVKDLQIHDAEVSFTLAFAGQSPATKAALHSSASKVVTQLPGVSRVSVKMGSGGAAARPQAQAAQGHAHGQPAPAAADLIPEVKRTIAISSGKGGVGKSTVAVNLALALQQSGAQVGLVDVDVYGPDVPLMMGAKSRPGMFENRIIPVEAHRIKIMSIGLLVAEREALVWRGPMIHSAVQQFLRDVNWGPLDYLVFDMPPGTGDAQLSLSQVVPLSGVVMVTTPQDVALLDVRKALGMFRKLNVPILGIVENMSYFLAPDTGRR